MKRFLSLALIAMIVWVAPSGAQSRLRRRVTQGNFPLRVVGASLVDRTGTPVYLVGEAAWSLESQITETDAETYLADRQARGINTVLMEGMEHRFANNAPNNASNIAPFSTPGDFSTPNATYWAWVDRLIRSAANRGMTVLFAPWYIGNLCGNEGWCVEIQAQTGTVAQNFGAFLGARYKAYDNIVWVVGGDADPTLYTGVSTKTDAFVTGLQSAGVTQPITAHASRGTEARSVFTNSWLAINTSYQTQANAASGTATAWGRTPFLPVLFIEGYYENEHTMTALLLRTQAYWALLSGATLGYVHGGCPTWSFGSTNGAAFCDSVTTWQTQITGTPSQDLARFGALVRSRRFWLLVPDTGHAVTTSGFSSGASLVTTARASDGSSVIAYLPTGSSTPIVVDMTKVGGATARCWWFNPRTGATSSAHADASTSGTLTFTAADTNDWVLVLDNLAVFSAAPGS